jgi:hypothetical protein
MSISEKYIPKLLLPSDKIKQKKNILKSRKLYREGKYHKRPKLKSFKSKKSQHLTKVKQLYDIEPLKITKELVEKTKCSKEGLEKIVNKGMGAYYSSGSRPNQTAESWGVARLASALTGGPSSIVDYHILESECKKNSPSLKLAKKTCKREKKCKRNLNKTKKNNAFK